MLRHTSSRKGTSPKKIINMFFNQVAAGLTFMQERSLVRRDIKLENIFFRQRHAWHLHFQAWGFWNDTLR